jgi:hypothetical protein
MELPTAMTSLLVTSPSISKFTPMSPPGQPCRLGEASAEPNRAQSDVGLYNVLPNLALLLNLNRVYLLVEQYLHALSQFIGKFEQGQVIERLYLKLPRKEGRGFEDRSYGEDQVMKLWVY